MASQITFAFEPMVLSEQEQRMLAKARKGEIRWRRQNKRALAIIEEQRATLDAIHEAKKAAKK